MCIQQLCLPRAALDGPSAGLCEVVAQDGVGMQGKVRKACGCRKSVVEQHVPATSKHACLGQVYLEPAPSCFLGPAII